MLIYLYVLNLHKGFQQKIKFKMVCCFFFERLKNAINKKKLKISVKIQIMPLKIEMAGRSDQIVKKRSIE